MSLCLDIYVLTPSRDLECVSRFLSQFAHPTTNLDRTGEELMVVPSGATSEPSSLDDYEWHPISTLEDGVNFGLANPPQAFRLYLRPRDYSIEQAMLGFRADGSLVLGLSIADDESEAAVERAKALLAELAATYNATMGFIAWEVPAPIVGPPAPKENERVLYEWKQGAA